MRKRVLSIALVLLTVITLIPTAVAAVSTETQYDNVWFFSEGLISVGLNGKWGYIDKSGKEIIPMKYDEAYPFSEGLAAVKLNGKWGFIDKSGKEIIPYEYDMAISFTDGLAGVMIDTKCGYIDKTGKVVIPLKYDELSNFSEGLAEVRLNGKCSYIDKTGKEVIPLMFFGASAFSDGLAWVWDQNWEVRYIDKSGKTAIPATYSWANTFSEGFAIVQSSGWFVIDVKGNQRELRGFDGILGGIDSAGMFFEGLAWVRTTEWVSADYKYADKYGFIDTTGKLIIPTKYDEAVDFSEGYAQVKIAGRYGIIDKTGKEVVPAVYDGVRPVYEGMTALCRGGKWSIVSLNNTLPEPAALIAKPSASTVYVNGTAVAFDAYNINDENYFKLRDVAYALNGTRVQFDAAWDGAANMISLTSGKAYTPDGSEMKAKGTSNKTPVLNKSKILLDGKEVELTAYTIDGNNYFKMRELAQVFDFSVEYYGTIFIDTTKGYTAP